MMSTLNTAGIDNIIRNMPNGKQYVLKSAAFQVEALAKQHAPVDTGALKNSLNSYEVDENTWRVADGVEYGIYQELGTSRMAAHPFLVPAMEAVSPEFLRRISEIFK